MVFTIVADQPRRRRQAVVGVAGHSCIAPEVGDARLQTVARSGNRATDDHAHRVVRIRVRISRLCDRGWTGPGARLQFLGGQLVFGDVGQETSSFGRSKRLEDFIVAVAMTACRHARLISHPAVFGQTFRDSTFALPCGITSVDQRAGPGQGSPVNHRSSACRAGTLAGVSGAAGFRLTSSDCFRTILPDACRTVARVPFSSRISAATRGAFTSKTMGGRAAPGGEGPNNLALRSGPYEWAQGRPARQLMTSPPGAARPDGKVRSGGPAQPDEPLQPSCHPVSAWAAMMRHGEHQQTGSGGPRKIGGEPGMGGDEADRRKAPDGDAGITMKVTSDRPMPAAVPAGCRRREHDPGTMLAMPSPAMSRSRHRDRHRHWEPAATRAGAAGAVEIGGQDRAQPVADRVAAEAGRRHGGRRPRSRNPTPRRRRARGYGRRAPVGIAPSGIMQNSATSPIPPRHRAARQPERLGALHHFPGGRATARPGGGDQREAGRHHHDRMAKRPDRRAAIRAHRCPRRSTLRGSRIHGRRTRSPGACTARPPPHGVHPRHPCPGGNRRARSASAPRSRASGEGRDEQQQRRASAVARTPDICEPSRAMIALPPASGGRTDAERRGSAGRASRDRCRAGRP